MSAKFPRGAGYDHLTDSLYILWFNLLRLYSSNAIILAQKWSTKINVLQFYATRGRTCELTTYSVFKNTKDIPEGTL